MTASGQTPDSCPECEAWAGHPSYGPCSHRPVTDPGQTARLAALLHDLYGCEGHGDIAGPEPDCQVFASRLAEQGVGIGRVFRGPIAEELNRAVEQAVAAALSAAAREVDGLDAVHQHFEDEACGGHVSCPVGMQDAVLAILRGDAAKPATALDTERLARALRPWDRTDSMDLPTVQCDLTATEWAVLLAAKYASDERKP